MADDETRISYSVKELFDKLDRKLDNLIATLAGKANHEDVVALQHRVDAIETEQEHQRRREAEKTEDRRYKVPLVWTVVMAAIGVASLLAAVLQLIK